LLVPVAERVVSIIVVPDVIFVFLILDELMPELTKLAPIFKSPERFIFPPVKLSELIKVDDNVENVAPEEMFNKGVIICVALIVPVDVLVAFTFCVVALFTIKDPVVILEDT
jgi:hypothetical protein